MAREFKLPPLYSINESSNGNDIRQIILPGTRLNGEAVTYDSDGVKGLVVASEGSSSQSEQILVIEKVPDKAHSFSKVIFIPKGIDTADSADLSECRWISHPLARQVSSNSVQLESVIESWESAFTFLAESKHPLTGAIKNGLREPQIGALHAILAHWSVSNEAATIVMPTGTGKTETMISAMVSMQCKRILVIVPTEALRVQIAEKFLSFGLLKQFGVISDSAKFPVVGILRHKPKNKVEVDAFFSVCNVIVSTSQIVGVLSDTLQKGVAHHCTELFIDEAHHVGAPTWNRLKETFSARRILQFTATPFREDDKHLGGKFIYRYPLARAQEKEYFTKINFRTVNVSLPKNSDMAIAELAIEQLRSDRKKKFPHILMARVNSIRRAKEVFEHYRAFSEFNPLLLHSEISSRERLEGKRRIERDESQIVVCVDMLGEGFDMPALKIAAFHDIRKSPSVTIQLAGRFTRARDDLGDATFIANIGLPDVREELKKLYTRDTDWNVILPQLSDQLSSGQSDLNDLADGFATFPSRMPIQSLTPAFSTVIYKTKCADWTPDNYLQGLVGLDSFDEQLHDINHASRTLLIMTSRKRPLDWTSVDSVYTWEWNLYVVFWDKDQNLLFINNSSNDGHFHKLAEAVCGADVELITGNVLFRALGKMTRITFRNVGLSEQGFVSYVSRMGSDVEAALTQIQQRRAIKSVLVGTGYEDAQRVIIGCSAKGRVWSQARSHNLDKMLKWCSSTGAKVIDDSIDENQFLDNTLAVKFVSKRPDKMPFAVDWNEDIYKESETALTFHFLHEGISKDLFELDINIIDASVNGNLRFQLDAGEASASFTLKLKKNGTNGTFDIESDGRHSVRVSKGKRTWFGEQFFAEHPPVFRFIDGSFLCGNKHVFPIKLSEAYPLNKIEAWDWTGTDLKKESQGLTKDAKSVQYKVIQYVKKRTYDLIFDDDDKGEVADLVTIAVDDTNKLLNVEFYHCKFSREIYAGARVDDLYVLCGQVQTCIRWFADVDKLYRRLRLREEQRLDKYGVSRIERGSLDVIDEITIKSSTYRTILKVIAVQPGLKKSKISNKQLELLGVTDGFLQDTYRIPFTVIGSV